MPQRICFISDKHKACDDRIYWKLALTLKQNGYDVSHICSGERKQEYQTKEGVNVYQYEQDLIKGLSVFKKTAKILRLKLSYQFLYDYINNVKADVYIISDIDPLIVSNFIKKRSWKPKLVYDVHDPFYINIRTYASGFVGEIKAFVYAYFTKFWELRRLKRHDAIIATEENWGSYFKKYFPSKVVSVIHNYPVFEGDDTKVEKEYDFIYAGTISEHRGLFNMIALIAELNKRTEKPQKLLLLGTIHSEDTKRRAIDLIGQLKLESSVIFMDSVAHNEIEAYYKKSKFGLILFNDVENHRIILPIKLFEYMIFGLPTIGTKIGHIEKTINDVGNGITVSCDDFEKLAKEIVALDRNQLQIDLMIEKGREAVKDRFHWEYEAEKLLILFKELI